LASGQDHRGRRRTARIRREQEDPRPKATPSGGHRRVGLQSQGPQLPHGARAGRSEAATTGVGTGRTLAPFSPVAGRRLRGKWQGVGRGGDGLERGGSAQAAQKPVPEKLAKVWVEAWATRRRARSSTGREAHATARICGFVSPVGGGADLLGVGAEQTVEPGDYEKLCASAEAFVYVAMIRLMVGRWVRL